MNERKRKPTSAFETSLLCDEMTHSTTTSLTSVAAPTPAKRGKRLTKGSYCEVFACTEQYIIKEMKDFGEHDGLSQGQLRECEVYFRLNDPVSQFIACQILECRTQDHRHFLSLKMPKYKDVWDMALDQHHHLMQVLPLLVDDITCALNRLHLSGYLHRDLKPGNMLFDPACSRFYLIDFGSANFENVNNRLTNWCTRSFAAPECDAPQRHAKYSFPSDIFSLGATILCLIFHRHLPPHDVTYDWRSWAEKQKWPSSLEHTRSTLLQAVELDPKKRCTLADLRRAFRRTVDIHFSWNYPLPWKNVPAQTLDRLFQIFARKKCAGVEAMRILYGWMAEVCAGKKWDKLTYLIAIQVLNDYAAIRHKEQYPLQAMATVALSLAQKLVEDDDDRLSDLYGLAVSTCSDDELFLMQRDMWVSLGYFLRRRPIVFAYAEMDWTSLVDYTCRQSI